MDSKSQWIDYLPRALREEGVLRSGDDLEEIRLRVGRPMELLYDKRSQVGVVPVTEEMITELLNYLSDYSLYRLGASLKRGYITIPGGHRIGVVGHMNEKGEIYQFGGVNIRLAGRKVSGVSTLAQLLVGKKQCHHTFIVAPPGVGKTTLLRNLIRELSGTKKVVVVDERGEIGGSYHGIPQIDLGPRTDVLDNCKKPFGIEMVLRSMSPEVIAVDELGNKEDFEAIHRAMQCGVIILGTIHGSSWEEFLQKPHFEELQRDGMIQRVIFLEKKESGEREYALYDDKQELLQCGYLESVW